MLNVKRRITMLLSEAVEKAQAAGTLPAVTQVETGVERPQNASHGDYATSLPLKLARAVGRSPLEIARDIAEQVNLSEELESVSVSAPGFINFIVKDDWLRSQVDKVLDAGDSYGNVESGQGRPVQLEFVSVNPTGPLHVGHGRGAILGSALANVLAAAGFRVEKEYYVNDAGNQIDTFRRSLYARYVQGLGQAAEMPEDGYQGQYLIDLAAQIAGEAATELAGLDEESALSRIGDLGLDRMLAQIKSDLELLDVTFDVWFSERSLYENGQYDTALRLLKEAGHLVKKENATWFVSTALGEDKDNVIIRSDGSPTYFAADIAYHYDKFTQRGFERVIDIWGADHLGHVSRMKVVLEALGIDPERLSVIISQMVTLRRGGELVRVSKRSGDIITLRDLVEEVGTDACRFFFLSRSADSQMDFDMELAVRQSADNPVYYVQYAHARIASILGVAGERGSDTGGGDVSLLATEPELTLIRKMLLLPEMVELIASTLEPHHLTYYAQDLANAFHSFYKHCRVVSDDHELTAARLKLVRAAKIVLGRTLRLMGMNAPEKM